MTAGYETTSAVLACATYELAKHPDILQKLQDEIDQLQLSTDDNTDNEAKKYPDYDTIAKMSYMDLFVSEVLRMYPNANFVIQRRALEDTVVQGIKVDKGNGILLCYSKLRSSWAMNELMDMKALRLFDKLQYSAKVPGHVKIQVKFSHFSRNFYQR